MKLYRLKSAFLCFCMVVLILDVQTAILGVKEGLELCLRTIIPALFPFMILSSMVTGQLLGSRIPFFSHLCRWMHMPQGSESIFLVGLLGGYPLGARAITQAWQQKQLSRQDARRMLGFCSNAGPAFLFGMAGSIFSSPKAAWILWGIHIISAVVTARLLPAGHSKPTKIVPSAAPNLSQALKDSIAAMAGVCGWVILFRILICFARRWFLWLLPTDIQLLTIGLLELSNGCCALQDASSEALAFVLCSIFLGFGGGCVAMQTVTVTQDLGTGFYLPGKLLQALVSFLLATGTCNFLFPGNSVRFGSLWLVCGLIVLLIAAVFLRKKEKGSSIPAISGV